MTIPYYIGNNGSLDPGTYIYHNMNGCGISGNATMGFRHVGKSLNKDYHYINDLHPWKLTWPIRKQPLEDVSPIKKWWFSIVMSGFFLFMGHHKEKHWERDRETKLGVILWTTFPMTLPGCKLYNVLSLVQKISWDTSFWAIYYKFLP